MREKLTVKINLNILAIVLHENETRKIRLRDIISAFNKISYLSKPIKYLIGKSRVSIFYHKKNDFPSLFSRISSLAIEQFLLTYLSINSKSFCVTKTETSHIKNETNKIRFDACFIFSFIHLINSALILLYYFIRNKAKEVINNV